VGAVLGFARSICTDKEIHDWTEGIQCTLLRLGSALATLPESKKVPPVISSDDVEGLMKLVHQIEATEGILADWPGGSAYRIRSV
jgi:cob(I)alamin adenosyltransferase